MQTPTHYLMCIKESEEAIERLNQQLNRLPKNKPGRKYLHQRIKCEKNIIKLLEKDYLEAVA